MSEMTPKEALRRVESAVGYFPYDARDAEALSVLRALVEGPTVVEVRGEIEKKIIACRERAYDAELTRSWSDSFRCEGAKSELNGLLDFIDRKGA